MLWIDEMPSEPALAAFSSFRRAYPSYAATAKLDELRRLEYGRLDAQGHLYLDYAGASLSAERQVRAHAALVAGSVLGNPHSNSPTSAASTGLVRSARCAVLDYFNASPDEYLAIFTANASGALKLVSEAYPFDDRSSYLLMSADNHNSVNGIREFARVRGARHGYFPIDPVELRMDEGRLLATLRDLGPRSRRGRISQRGVGGGAHLFAYPAQSNFSGVQHGLEWIAEAQGHGWDVLLDASAFVPTSRLDLGRWHPDFVTLSFYKMMGYPTGLGCLLARKSALAKLRRPWFSGGAVVAASVRGDVHRLAEGEAAFEDGTVDYLSIPAVEIGLDYLTEIGIDLIHHRVVCLTGWLLDALSSLRHATGRPLVQIYGPRTTDRRGGTIAMNFFDPSGRVVDHHVVERLALEHKISLRTGCFCNPGVGETVFAIDPSAIAAAFAPSPTMTYESYVDAVGLLTRGAVRVSLGLASTFEDVYRFVEVAGGLLDRRADARGSAPHSHA